ncbi:MAG: M24 family metallopeptidase [Halobacteriota archaeon]
MNTLNALTSYVKAGAVVRRVLSRAYLIAYVGMPIIELAEFIEKDIKRQGALPAFPVCLALNNEVAYHTPSCMTTDVLHIGDLLKVDVGAHVSGYIVDTAVTWEIDETAHAPLIRAAERAVRSALALIREGVDACSIAHRLERCVASDGLRYVCDSHGHSIERFILHGPTTVTSHARRVFCTGDVVAVEVTLAKSARVMQAGETEIYSLRPLFERAPLTLEARNAYSHLHALYGALPFSLRWLEKTGYVHRAEIKELANHGSLIRYPPLIEAQGQAVAHVERTVFVTRAGCIAL